MKTVSPAFLVAILLVAQGASGADWTLINSPNANNQANELHGVSAAADNDAWAVGTVYADNTFTKSQTLIEHWDGTHWSVPTKRGGEEPGAEMRESLFRCRPRLYSATLCFCEAPRGPTP